jgi:hypothetical protein
MDPGSSNASSSFSRNHRLAPRVALSAVVLSVAAGTGCGGSQAERFVEPTKVVEIDPESTEVQPTYSRQEMDRVLAEERQAHTAAASALATLMEQRGRSGEIALRLADVGVQQRYIDALQSCRDHGVWCPPKLGGLTWTIRELEQEVPVSLDAELRFDVTSWRKVAAELWARGCDCRSMTCVDAMTQSIDALEQKPTVEVQGDHEASTALTGARTCLWRLRGLAGKRVLAKVAPSE